MSIYDRWCGGGKVAKRVVVICNNNAREREFCRTVVMLYGGTYDEVLLMEAGMYFVFTN